MKRVVVGLSEVWIQVLLRICCSNRDTSDRSFMKNWHDDSVTISNDCPWLEDSNDALLVAEKWESLFKRLI
jgi:tRNA-specific 2-thiouridylase